MTTTPPTFLQAIERFRLHLETTKHPPRTVRDYTDDLILWNRWLTDNSFVEQVAQLSRDDVTEYLSYLAREHTGRASNDGQKGVAASTLKRKLAALRKFAAFLVEEGYHIANVTQNIKGPRVPRKEPVFFNQQEYKAILFEAQRRDKPRDYAILMTFIQTGIREGELCNLRLSDLDLTRHELTVRGRKGGVDTDIPLNSQAMDALNRWLEKRPEATTDHLFLSKTSKPLTDRSVRYLVKSYIRRAGIKKLASVHTLRHTFGSHKANMGVDIAQLQYWMGHKRKETTLTYIHLIKKRAPELMEQTAL
ncbi:MAG: hypothetical protein EPO21_01585 [Chloroflexota bacterium]|nr:MAG: hypothetical protein EPO21_01585 [Chloroflexota bacterium]